MDVVVHRYRQRLKTLMYLSIPTGVLMLIVAVWPEYLYDADMSAVSPLLAVVMRGVPLVVVLLTLLELRSLYSTYRLLAIYEDGTVAQESHGEDARGGASDGLDAIRPPRYAEMLLCLVLPLDQEDAVLGDLEERYYRHRERYGTGFAWVRYWMQVVRSLWPYLARAIRHLLKWGVLTWAGHILRRLLRLFFA